MVAEVDTKTIMIRRVVQKWAKLMQDGKFKGSVTDVEGMSEKSGFAHLIFLKQRMSFPSDNFVSFITKAFFNILPEQRVRISGFK